EYKSGVKLFHACRQQRGTAGDNSDHILGTAGVAHMVEVNVSHSITGKKPWRQRRRRDDKDDMYQNEHDALFASIRKGTPINDAEWMAHGSLMSIMGGRAPYTGQFIPWDMGMNSKEALTPPRYEFG